MNELNLKINENEKQQMASYLTKFNALVLEVENFKITDKTSKQKAIELVMAMEDLASNLKKYRDHLLKPFKDHIKSLEKEITPYEKKLKELTGDTWSGLRGQIGIFEKKEEEEIRKQEEKLRKEQEEKYRKEILKSEKKGELPPPAPIPIEIKKEKDEGVTYSETWDFDETNIDYSKVPDVFEGVRIKIIDDKAVRKLIKAGIRNIPGITIISNKTLIKRQEKIKTNEVVDVSDL